VRPLHRRAGHHHENGAAAARRHAGRRVRGDRQPVRPRPHLPHDRDGQRTQHGGQPHRRPGPAGDGRHAGALQRDQRHDHRQPQGQPRPHQ
ncbi:unnamed protein product, partial [Ectocarpus sp. 12 AP-2014]